MTKSAALKQARREVDLFRQGKQWVIGSWSPLHNAWFHGHPGDYFAKRAIRSELIQDRVNELMKANHGN